MTLDSDAFIHFTPTWLVSPVSNTFAKRGEVYPRYSSGFSGIQAAAAPISPSVKIHGPSVVSSCLPTFALDASYSTGHGSRPFTYAWGTTSGATISTTSSYIEVTTSELTVDAVSEFSLTLTNWAGQSASTTFSLSVTDETSISLLTLEGPQVITRSEAFTIYANADTCTSNELFYYWTVDNAAISLEHADQATLYIPSQKLQPGSYVFTVNVSDSDGDWTTGTFPISVNSNDLVAVIVDGSRTVSPNDPSFTLDCLTESYDPDQSYGTLQCDWTCEEGEGLCITASGSLVPLGTGMLSVDPSTLIVGKTYRFTAHVFKGDRQSDTWVEISVSNGDVATVTMSGPPIPQKVDNLNELVAAFDMGGDLQYSWYCNDTRAEEPGYDFIGGGVCKDENDQDIQKIAFDSSVIEYCEGQCTASLFCIGYSFSTGPNGLCSLYGITHEYQITACGTFECTLSSGTALPIKSWDLSIHGEAGCYSKKIPLSYTDISNLTSSLATHADGTKYSVLTIPANTFQQGQVYFIKFTVTNGTFTGEGGWLISSLTVPESGEITVDGKALVASGWTHEYLPLEYQFSLLDSNGIAWTLGRQYHFLMEHSEVPYGAQTLQVCASDRFGAKIEDTTSFTGALDTSTHASLVSDFVTKPATSHNWRSLLYGVFVIQSFLSELSAPLQEQYALHLFEALSNHSSLYMDDVNTLDLIGGIAKLDLSEDSYVNKIDALISLVSTIELHNMKQVLYRSGQLLSADSSYSDRVREIDEKVLQLGLLTVQHEQDSVTFSTSHAGLLMAWSFSSVLTSSFSGSDITIDLGSSFASEFGAYDCGSSTCFGVKISSLHYSSDIFTQSDDLWMQSADAHLVSSTLKLILANPSTNAYVSVSGLEIPITINFTLSETLNQTHYLYHCATWDSVSELWSSATAATVQGSEGSCALSQYSQSTSVLAIVARLKTLNPTPSPTEPPTHSPTECIQGGVTEWSEWTECITPNNRTRVRSCSNPEPTCWWKNCTEPLLDTQCCTDTGYYEEWSDWTDCTYRGSGFFGNGEYIHRTRTCVNPNLACGGLNCTGEPEEWIYCGNTSMPSTTPTVGPIQHPTFSPTSLPQGPCDVDWGYFKDPNQVNGSCYYKTENAMTRADAFTYCSQATQFGGMLFAAKTVEENLMVFRMCEIETPDNCWIGGTSQGWEVASGVYVAYEFQNWHVSVTNVASVQFAYFAKTITGEWHSADGVNEFHAICEIVFDGCMWPVVSNRLTWEKGAFGLTYSKPCSAGYVGSVTRECTRDGWMEAIDGCEVYISGGTWTDDTATDGYGWSNPIVSNGAHGPFTEGTNSTKVFTMNLEMEDQYVQISFQYTIIKALQGYFAVWSGTNLLWTSENSAVGSYTADFVASVDQLGDADDFELTFGSTSSRRRLSSSGSISFTNLTLSTMTREEVAQTYCINQDAYRGGNYYVGFNHSQSGFGSSSQAGYLRLVLEIPRYFYGVEIGFENALDGYGGYNISREYPQINETSPSIDRTYWNSDRASDEVCGSEVWDAEIPWSVFMSSGGVISLDSYSVLDSNNDVVETDAGLYYVYGSILTVAVKESISNTYSNNSVSYTWNTEKKQKYAFPFVLKFARDVQVSVAITVPACPATNSDCTLDYVAAVIQYSSVIRNYTTFEVGTVQVSIKTKVRYPYIFVTSTTDVSSNYFLPDVIATPATIDGQLQQVTANISFSSEVGTTCTFEHDIADNANKICEQVWLLEITPNEGSCYATGTYVVTWYAECFRNKPVCYIHESNGQIQNEATISFHVVSHDMCPIVADNIDLGGSLCATGDTGYDSGSCASSSETYMQGEDVYFALQSSSSASKVLKTEIISIGTNLNLDAIAALDASERPRYDYSWNGQSTIWSLGDTIPSTVSWADAYGSKTISLVQEVIDSTTWGDPAYAGFRITLDPHFFPSSLQASASVTITAVFQVTYEGFENSGRRELVTTRRRLASAQLDLRQTTIQIQPLSNLKINDYLMMSSNPTLDVDMSVVMTLTPTLR